MEIAEHELSIPTVKEVRETHLKAGKKAGARSTIRVGIDIGGTFTDLVAADEKGGIWKIKVLTTPTDPSTGALDAVRRLLKKEEVSAGLVRAVTHATTLASNALLTGSVPKTALVTTSGFRDVLEIARQNRPELYNLQVERLPPLVPRRYRFEVSERIAYDGRVLEPLDTSQAVLVARSIRRLGIGTVAVCLLHSYANPSHEKKIREIFRREHPRAKLSLSSELLPEFREYERTSTTVVNACLQPLFSNYLEKLEHGLEELGVRAPLFVMQSNSGTVLSHQAALEPVRLIESGPVAGAVASKFYTRGPQSIVSLDVGGTTSKAGAWSGHGFEETNEYEVGGRLHGTRRVEGSGYPVRFPVVDLVEVGIGGGSVAWVDGVGVLHVGPQSAGALPGPACYGKGGKLPTLTDASLVLGRLSSSFLLGGELRLSSQLAYTAVARLVAKPLRMSVINGAIGVLKIAISRIAEALRAATVEKGLDPREMVLVAFGGAGPMFACEVAEQLEMEKVVVPPAAGLLSSLGLLLAEPLHDSVQTVLRDAESPRVKEVEKIFRGMEKRARGLLLIERVEEKDVAYQRFLDMRYQGQSYELSIPLQNRIITGKMVRSAVRDFHQKHQTQYGYSQPEKSVEIVNVRSYCRGKAGTILRVAGTFAREKGLANRRRVWFADGRGVECHVLQRNSLLHGTRGKGPCVIEDYDSTLVVPPRARYVVEQNGSVSIAI
ncbi:MAG TPA: hydantoinase/oxoprolinase family protein [Candidatus Sulfotelmatobacter sp.]|nr:hydantoinase/oxoprolinase family protein [Candidatus Sulfotelmatobacter sp.]